MKRKAFSFVLSAVIIAAMLLPPLSAQAPDEDKNERAGALAPFLDVCGVLIGVCGGWVVILGLLCASPASCVGLCEYCCSLVSVIVPVFLYSLIPYIPIIIVKILSILPVILTFLFNLCTALLTVTVNLAIVCIPLLPRLCILCASLCVACGGVCGGLGIGCCGLITRFCGGLVK